MTRLNFFLLVMILSASGYSVYLAHHSLEESRRNREAVQRVMEDFVTVEKNLEEMKLQWAARKEGGLTPELKPETKPSFSSSYKVQKGENLWRISQRFYRTPWRWHAIWMANKERLPNYKKMPAGFVLKLPT